MIPTALLLAVLATASAEPADAHWIDFDGDGYRDLVQIGAGRDVQILRNEGDGTFSDVTKRVGLGGLRGAVQVAFADYDGDGHDDALFVRANGSGQLFRGLLGGVWTAVGSESGLELDGPIESAAWIDFDRDGRLDLQLAAAGQSALFRNVGGAIFEPVALGGSSSVTASGTTQSSKTGQHSLLDLCAKTLADALTPGLCLEASSIPTLGMLAPLSTDWFIADTTGFVGLGNTDPAVRLDVDGTVRSARRRL